MRRHRHLIVVCCIGKGSYHKSCFSTYQSVTKDSLMFSVYDGELYVVTQYDHVMCASRDVYNVTGGRFSEFLCRKLYIDLFGYRQFSRLRMCEYGN